MAEYPALELKINTAEVIERLGALGVVFEAGSSRLKIAQSRAINRTLIHMRKLIVKDIRSTYHIKTSDVHKSMELKKARSGKIASGSLRFADRDSVPLIHFAKQRKNFISVRVLKTSRAKMLEPGGDHGILAASTGRARVWIGKTRAGEDQVFAMMEHSDSPQMLWGPSFMAFFRRPGVAEQLRAQAAEFFQARLEHEARFMLSGAGKVNFGRGR